MTEHHSGGNETRTHEIETVHFTLRYPEHLQIEPGEQVDGVELVLASTETDLPFRPSLVCTSVPSAAPLVDASVAAILAAGQQHPGARVISVDAFFASDASTDDPLIGRVLSFTYPVTKNLDVLVKKWVVATGEHHLHVVASFLPSQASAVEDTFDWIMANLRFTATAAALHDAAAGPSVSGVRLDDAATERARFPLEDLSIVPVSEPESARAIPVGAVEALANAWGVGLGSPKALHVTISRGEIRGFYAAYPGRDGVLVLRTSGSSLFSMVPESAEGYAISAERLPADAAAWLGIAPAFLFGENKQLPLAEYQAHLAGDDHEDPWIEILIELRGRWWRAVFVPGRGFFEAISPTAGTVELSPLPAARFFDLILRQLDFAFGGAVSPDSII